MSNIKFNLHHVTDGITKCRVYYSIADREGIKTVTLHAKNYGRELLKLFRNAINESDAMTDYFETSRVTFVQNDPYFDAAFAAAQRLRAHNQNRWEKRVQKENKRSPNDG